MSSSRGLSSAERGDFQTPHKLAREVWAAVDWDVPQVLEPTVGKGSFLATAPRRLLGAKWLAFDIHEPYVEASRTIASALGFSDATIGIQDVFLVTASTFADMDPAKPLLVIGNPPWVTSAQQGAVASNNVPAKSNFLHLRGMDALTGKSNFDLAEAVLHVLVDATAHFREVRFALLTKVQVATSALRWLSARGDVTDARMTLIDARREFGSSVDAGLFEFRRLAPQGEIRPILNVLPGWNAAPLARVGFHDRIVYDAEAYAANRELEATSSGSSQWRQGIKHDVAGVLELRKRTDGQLENRRGELVDVEDDLLCAFYKSSDLMAERAPRFCFPLYQHDLSGPIRGLATTHPQTHAYLAANRSRFAARRSRVYHSKPDFMLFGVGPYTLAPYKVATAGLAKQPRFRLLRPSPAGNPPLVDDTCYFIPFEDEAAAEYHLRYLNGSSAKAFLVAVSSPFAKRRFTKEVLSRLRLPEDMDADAATSPAASA